MHEDEPRENEINISLPQADVPGAEAQTLSITMVGVKFRREGKVYTFAAGDHILPKGEMVIVETDHGLAMGKVATEVFTGTSGRSRGNLKMVVRVASDEDLKIRASNQTIEEESRRYFRERVNVQKLPMKLTEVECLFDKSKIIFYFSSENRVDFRDLVKDLVQKFKTKIELRQIGARQEARIIKGLGVCGREVCCAVMLRNVDRVSVKMAKEQNLSLNPEKISGLCGRLMCCLAFEYDTYVDMKNVLPKCGKAIVTPKGHGKVTRQYVLSGDLSVELEDGTEILINHRECHKSNPRS